MSPANTGHTKDILASRRSSFQVSSAPVARASPRPTLPRPLLHPSLVLQPPPPRHLRCYEAKVGRVGVVRTNILYDHTLTLWSASSNTTTSGVSELARGRGAAQAQAYPSPPPSPTELPQTDFPFHIVIPPRAAGGCSTVKLQSYRVYWRLEACESPPYSIPLVLVSLFFWGLWFHACHRRCQRIYMW
ncbi:hypothetical protein DL93DRAFT_175963 [Clavulina sp. PMI_390]|nr:hypothetical protein DL93DRAFT_175963 [Clavulina sp. PMI_390]